MAGRFGWRILALLAVGAAALLACNGKDGGNGGGGGPGPGGVSVTQVASGLSSPIFVASLPGDERIFIVERNGTIRIFENGALSDFLDIVGKVEDQGGERGLLSMAFDPDFPHNGLFYVYYTDLNGDSQLSRFRVTSDPNVADMTEDTLMHVVQPATNHNGGTIAFNPMPGDDALYWALGDGGGGNDPDERAQDPQDLLGKILRLDVGDQFGDSVAIPADNPFAGVNDPGNFVRDEIWALGLRNPFRFSFDWQTGAIWIGDVGEGALEEVDYEPGNSDGGMNWGWDPREGTGAANCATNGCSAPPWWHGPPPTSNFNNPALFDDPIHEYGHSNGRCSITGGVVYRGPEAVFDGLYFFGDWCTGEVWSLRRIPLQVTDRTAEFAPAAGPDQQLVAFGEDGFGGMLIVLSGGTIWRVGDTGDECDNGVDDDGDGDTDLSDDGCRDADDPSELDSQTACDDGFDNDGDTAIDYLNGAGDPQCASSTDDDESA